MIPILGRLVILGGISLIALMLAACGGSSTPLPEQTSTLNAESTLDAPLAEAPLISDLWTVYRSDKHRYTIDVPPNWQTDDSDPDEVVFFVEQSSGLAGLHILTLDWPGTSEDLSLQNFNFHIRRAGVMFQPGLPTLVKMNSGISAERAEFRVLNDARFCTELLVDVLLVADKRGYILQGSVCENFDQIYGSTIEEMQQSFKLISERAMGSLGRR